MKAPIVLDSCPLGGSWVVISRVIRPLIWFVSTAILLIILLTIHMNLQAETPISSHKGFFKGSKGILERIYRISSKGAVGGFFVGVYISVMCKPISMYFSVYRSLEKSCL